MTDDDLTQVMITIPGKNIPQWKRTAFVARDGQVYLPGAMGGSETAVLLSAGFDGISTFNHRKHIFVPAAWLAQESPSSAEAIIRYAEKMRASASSNEQIA